MDDTTILILCTLTVCIPVLFMILWTRSLYKRIENVEQRFSRLVSMFGDMSLIFIKRCDSKDELNEMIIKEFERELTIV